MLAVAIPPRIPSKIRFAGQVSFPRPEEVVFTPVKEVLDLLEVAPALVRVTHRTANQRIRIGAEVQ